MLSSLINNIFIQIIGIISLIKLYYFYQFCQIIFAINQLTQQINISNSCKCLRLQKSQQLVSILIIMQEGRRYRATQEVFVRDWDTFRKAWRGTGFIKEWGEQENDECKRAISKCLDELISDQAHQCYVFPDSLKPAYIATLIDLIISEKYSALLDYEHQGLYLDKPKQLVIFKKRASVSTYLAKYRLPNQYRKLLEAVIETWKLYLPLLAQKNLRISKELSKQQINEVIQKIKLFQENELAPKLNNWRKLVMRIIEDFKKQPKKDQIMFLGVNSILSKEIKQLCKKYQLYESNRYEKISPYDEYRDVTVSKYDRNTSTNSFDDNSDSSELEQTLPQVISIKQEQQKVIQPPKSIQNVNFIGFIENGVKCSIVLQSFGKINPIDYVEVKLINPCQNQFQKNYVQKINITEGQQECEALLHCLHVGVSTYQFKTCNSAGQCKKPYLFKVWISGLKETVNEVGIMKVSCQNYLMSIIGENENGLIPNIDPKSQTISTTTEQNWMPLNLQCAQFSVSTHISICNREGQVASWGKMYYYDDAGLAQDANEDNQEEDDYNLVKLKPQTYRIENPSLILQNECIRSVSCGQGYCLMVDSLGKAWSFGLNNFGQLGLEHEDEDVVDPVIIPFFKISNIFVVSVVASCFGGSFAIDDSGQAYRWGTNQVQQTNKPVKDNFNNIINFQYLDVTSAQSLPMPISKKSIDEKIKEIHAGMYFAFALTQSNKLYGWGNTRYLGIGNIQDAHFKNIDNLCNPIYISQNICKLSVGETHCLALKIDKTLVGWGQKLFFQDKQNNNHNQIFSDKFIIIQKQFQGEFVCGKNFTVMIGKGKKDISIKGNNKVFKKRQYELPFDPIQVKTGQGIVVISGKKSTLKKNEEKNKNENE